jgi:hypothetical protein
MAIKDFSNESDLKCTWPNLETNSVRQPQQLRLLIPHWRRFSAVVQSDRLPVARPAWASPPATVGAVTAEAAVRPDIEVLHRSWKAAGHDGHFAILLFFLALVQIEFRRTAKPLSEQ